MLDLLLTGFSVFDNRFFDKLLAFFTDFYFSSGPKTAVPLNETLLCLKCRRDELLAGGLGALNPPFLFRISVKWSLILFL